MVLEYMNAWLLNVDGGINVSFNRPSWTKTFWKDCIVGNGDFSLVLKKSFYRIYEVWRLNKVSKTQLRKVFGLDKNLHIVFKQINISSGLESFNGKVLANHEDSCGNVF